MLFLVAQGDSKVDKKSTKLQREKKSLEDNSTRKTWLKLFLLMMIPPQFLRRKVLTFQPEKYLCYFVNVTEEARFSAYLLILCMSSCCSSCVFQRRRRARNHRQQSIEARTESVIHETQRGRLEESRGENVSSSQVKEGKRSRSIIAGRLLPRRRRLVLPQAQDSLYTTTGTDIYLFLFGKVVCMPAGLQEKERDQDFMRMPLLLLLHLQLRFLDEKYRLLLLTSADVAKFLFLQTSQCLSISFATKLHCVCKNRRLVSLEYPRCCVT